jgi:hypothetical protein
MIDVSIWTSMKALKHVKQISTTVLIWFPRPCCVEMGPGLDVRARREFPQCQRRQCYVQMLALGAVGFLSPVCENTALGAGTSPTRPAAPYVWRRTLF